MAPRPGKVAESGGSLLITSRSGGHDVRTKQDGVGLCMG